MVISKTASNKIVIISSVSSKLSDFDPYKLKNVSELKRDVGNRKHAGHLLLFGAEVIAVEEVADWFEMFVSGCLHGITSNCGLTSKVAFDCGLKCKELTGSCESGRGNDFSSSFLSVWSCERKKKLVKLVENKEKSLNSKISVSLEPLISFVKYF